MVKSATGLYSEGVASHSPGLPRFAATLGYGHETGFYPNGVAPFVVRHGRNPFGVDHVVVTPTQGSSLREQPWAVRRNSFGVRTLPVALRKYSRENKTRNVYRAKRIGAPINEKV